MWCFFSDTRAPTFCVALPNLVYLCYILLLKIYFPQNKKEIDRNLDISVPVFNSFSYSMRSISSRHTLVMHAVPSELQAAHEEGKIKYLRREEVKKKNKKKNRSMHGVTDCLSLSNWWRHCRSNQWHWDDQGWLRFKIGLGRGVGCWSWHRGSR